MELRDFVAQALVQITEGVLEALAGRTEELERLNLEMYARGLSMRDIEAAFTGRDGPCALSKSAATHRARRAGEVRRGTD